MALDVYAFESPRRPSRLDRPSFQFEDAVHDAIFFGGGVEIESQYAYLRRMIDFYADAKYSSDELEGLVAEIDDLLPKVAAGKRATNALTQFRETCLAASASGACLVLIAD